MRWGGAAMTAADEAGPTIRRGPRWDAVLASIAEAEVVFDGPLAPEELEDGWSDELRGSILADLRRVRDELVATNDTSVVLEDWSAVDSLDTTGDSLRVDAIFDVDLVLGELERAERALQAANALTEDLEVPPSTADVEDGFDDAARAELRSMLESLCRALAEGAYLSAPEMDRWANALRAWGFLRASAAPGLQDDAAATGFTRQRIEQFPTGRRWERVAIFDEDEDMDIDETAGGVRDADRDADDGGDARVPV
jgi:hypothetical protein